LRLSKIELTCRQLNQNVFVIENKMEDELPQKRALIECTSHQ